MSAVSRKITPASSAASTTDAVASGSNRPPKLLQPRPTNATSTDPILRVSMQLPLPLMAMEGDRHQHPRRERDRRVGNPPLQRHEVRLRGLARTPHDPRRDVILRPTTQTLGVS